MMIRSTLIVSFLFMLFPAAGLCQNNATVKQQGSGNTASINQSNDESTDKAQSSDDCDETRMEYTGDENKIMVKSTDGTNETLLNATGNQINDVSAILDNLRELSASQNGAANSLLITLPDTGHTPNRFTSKQEGERNAIVTRFSSSPSEISVSQGGTGNAITINPCDGKNSESKTGNNSVTVEQNSSNDSATIKQQ